VACFLVLTYLIWHPALADSKRIVAAPARSAIVMDGVLDEPAWSQAGVIRNLVQQSPVPGGATPYQTEVRILVDRDTLYLGITCLDPQPDLIAVHKYKRDARLGSDDNVVLVFDTFADQRSGFFFRTNAVGARVDGLVSGPRDRSDDWDGIWDVRTQRTGSGWTAEFVIPARSLRFTPGLDHWGFNVERFVARDRIRLRWSEPVLDAGFFDLKRAGMLAGVGKLEQGVGLDISPFSTGLVNTGFGPEGVSKQGRFGLDASYNITPELTGVLTVNTDFGETEVDSRQVNLTRFSLFFPEKRTFFAQGSNQFGFAQGLGSRFIPFFSRRIGLFDDRRVPINAGVKLIGRNGPWGIAALDVQTRDVANIAATNLFAGRFSYDVSPKLRIGTMITHGDPDGVEDNTLVGVDAVWQTSEFLGGKDLSFSSWLAPSSGDLADGQETGWGLRAQYPNDLWDFAVRYDVFGDALDPALGFLPRPGTRQFAARAAYKPRPVEGSALDWVRQFFVEFSYSQVAGLDGITQSRRLFTAPLNFTTDDGDRAELNWSPRFERLDEPFEIAPGVIIPVGSYHFTRYRVEAESARTRSWQVRNTVWFGEFFDGHLTQWEKSVSWSNGSGQLRLELSLEDNFGHLREGNFVNRLWQGRIDYSITPDISISSFIQYDSDSRDVGMNNRFRWTIHPGKDLFVVWNRNWTHPIGSDQYSLSPAADQVLVKLVWTFRS